jgi:hypothetical protein
MSKVAPFMSSIHAAGMTADLRATIIMFATMTTRRRDGSG